MGMRFISESERWSIVERRKCRYCRNSFGVKRIEAERRKCGRSLQIAAGVGVILATVCLRVEAGG